MLGNVKNAILPKHLPRFMAEFDDRFNRRFDPASLLARLATAAAQTPPMPYRLVKLAVAHWQSSFAKRDGHEDRIGRWVGQRPAASKAVQPEQPVAPRFER